MNSDKAPGPDGFPPFFFKAFWPIIKNDVIQAVKYILVSGSMPSSWKRIFVALVPKIPNPQNVLDYI